MCLERSNAPDVNYWGESFGPSSMCFLSTIVDERFQKFYVNQGSTCHVHTCVNGELQLVIGGQWFRCPMEGGRITPAGFRGYLECPPARDFCP